MGIALSIKQLRCVDTGTNKGWPWEGRETVAPGVVIPAQLVSPSSQWDEDEIPIPLLRLAS